MTRNVCPSTVSKHTRAVLDEFPSIKLLQSTGHADGSMCIQCFHDGAMSHQLVRARMPNSCSQCWTLECPLMLQTGIAQFLELCLYFQRGRPVSIHRCPELRSTPRACHIRKTYLRCGCGNQALSRCWQGSSQRVLFSINTVLVDTSIADNLMHICTSPCSMNTAVALLDTYAIRNGT